MCSSYTDQGDIIRPPASFGTPRGWDGAMYPLLLAGEVCRARPSVAPASRLLLFTPASKSATRPRAQQNRRAPSLRDRSRTAHERSLQATKKSRISILARPSSGNQNVQFGADYPCPRQVGWIPKWDMVRSYVPALYFALPTGTTEIRAKVEEKPRIIAGLVNRHKAALLLLAVYKSLLKKQVVRVLCYR